MKLLFNYLPYPMKDSDPVVRSSKKASTKATTNGTTTNTKITKFFSSFYSSRSNSTPITKANGDETNKKKVQGIPPLEGEKLPKKRGRKKKITDGNTDIQRASLEPAQTNGVKRKRGRPPSRRPSTDSMLASSASIPTVLNGKSSSILSTPTKSLVKKKSKKGNSKSSPKLRPRRRASQTYFFKYQLARNPLKAEEEDLKLALLASLQQCDGDTSNQELEQQLKRQQLAYEDHIKNHKQPKKAIKAGKHQQPGKQQKQKHPSSQETTVVENKLDPSQPIFDKEYSESKRPDTEDFLSFICFRTSTQHYTQNVLPTNPTASGSIEHSSKFNPRPVNGFTNATTGIHVKISNDEPNSNEFHNLRRSTSPCKSSASVQTVSNSSPNHLNSPSNRRRPTRHSPRLASSSRKISEFDSLNQNTAYDNQLNYEEDMKKASLALEDMAQEINGSDDNEQSAPNIRQLIATKLAAASNGASPTQTQPITNGMINSVNNSNNHAGNNNNNNNNNAPSTIRSMSPFKNNKHLVKGLMTREFAGAFADEDIIFESIKNHKL